MNLLLYREITQLFKLLLCCMPKLFLLPKLLLMIYQLISRLSPSSILSKANIGNCLNYKSICYPVMKVMGFPWGSAGKESTCNVGDLVSIPGLRRSPGEEKGYPLQYSGLENSMHCIVHGVAKSPTRLSDFHVSRSC